MTTDTATPTIDTPTPSPDTPAVSVGDSSETPDVTSIADHAEQFSPTRPEREVPANTGQFANKPPDARHRAQSQRATPEDVAEINRLTKELRETEARLKDKDPDAGTSPRVRALKRQIAALKALESPEPASDTPKPAPTAPKMSSDAAPSTFSEKEPDFNDYQDTAKYPDPLAAWMRDTARYEARKLAHEERVQAQVQQARQAEEAEVQAYRERERAFAATVPDYEATIAPLLARQLTPSIVRAVATSDNGPAYVYHLAQHSELVDDLVFTTDGRPVTDASVAYVQRRLKESVQAAQGPDRPPQTPTYIPPKPPNPVRTGPIKTADDPPGETASIADHAKYYGQKRR